MCPIHPPSPSEAHQLSIEDFFYPSMHHARPGSAPKSILQVVHSQSHSPRFPVELAAPLLQETTSSFALELAGVCKGGRRNSLGRPRPPARLEPTGSWPNACFYWGRGARLQSGEPRTATPPNVTDCFNPGEARLAPHPCLLLPQCGVACSVLLSLFM
jgi:hypothetical protein